MRRFWRWVVLSLAVVASLGGSPPVESMVRIESNPGCLLLNVGSGVVVAPGVVVTNAHVVHGSQSILVKWQGSTFRVQAHVLAPELDLALIRVPALPAPPVQLAREAPSLGTEVTALGFPRGTQDAPVIIPASISALWKYRGTHLLQVEAALLPGSSGGGLFLPDGRLLGITTFNLLGTDKANFSLPMVWVERLLQQPWTSGDAVPLCKPRSVLLHELLDRLTEDPDNRSPWEAFTRAWVHTKPHDADAWYALGHVLLLRHETLARQGIPDPGLEKAMVEAFQKSLKLNPAHTRAWNNLGAAFFTLGRLEEALESYTTAVRLNPEYGLAWFNLAGVRLEMRAFTQAVEAAKTSLRFMPDNHTAWARLGFCEARLGHHREAIDAYRVALRYNPFRRDWLIDLAESHHELGQLQDVERIAEDLQARDPEGARELRDRQRVWHRLKQQGRSPRTTPLP